MNAIAVRPLVAMSDEPVPLASLLIPDGGTRPYRPCPADFRDRFLEMGWDGIEDHYRTNWRIIRRWIEECGGDALRAARRQVSGGTERPALRAESRAARYIMGKTLSAPKGIRKDRSKNLQDVLTCARLGRSLEETVEVLGLHTQTIYAILRRELGSGMWPPDLSAVRPTRRKG